MMDKLYPPSIAGTLPSFYTTLSEGTTIVVPFSMNKIVSINQVKGFKLRIKTTNTDILYGVIDNLPVSWDRTELISPSVSFRLPETIKNKLTVGSYYKVQLAYVDHFDVIGYYSTVAIIKYTSKPSVSIQGFDLGQLNPYSPIYIGEYNNLDTTEKVYQYKFNLYDAKDNLLESSDWRLHNSYEDTSLTSSIDRYNTKYAFDQNLRYKICYIVKTNNGLEVSSPRYLVMESTTIDPEVNVDLIAKLDYDNACINLTFETKDNKTITGSFLLSRTSSIDNYSSWTDIADLKLIGELPSKFLFKDFAIEQGANYMYALTQYTDNKKIYSNKLLSNRIMASFEDIFLYDGKKQLRIRFNSKVSSFKSVVQESKKVTLGGKYPIILRNGAVEYKEFPINGLISYYMDNDELFFSIEKDLNIADWVPTTDIIDDNIYIERKFKMAVLEWLNNGEVKLFKSPSEGNYIVRLMNVNLTPVDQTSRMLHNFSCTATEIAELNMDNLIQYGLIEPLDVVVYQTRWQSVLLSDLWLKTRKNPNDIYNIDLLDGHKAYSIDFRDLRFGQKFSFQDSQFNTHIFMVGATGAYFAEFNDPIMNLKLVPPREEKTGNETLFNSTYNYENIVMQGMLNFSFKSTAQNTFDYIINIGIRDIPVYQAFGPDNDILKHYNNFRKKVSRIYYTRFSALEVRPIYDEKFGTKYTDGTYFTGTIKELKQSEGTQHISPVYNIPIVNQEGKVVPRYYRFYQGKLYLEPKTETVFNPEELNQYTLYKYEDSYYRLYGDQLRDVTAWARQHNINQNRPSQYRITQDDLTPYVIYEKYLKDGSKQYFKYNGYELIKLDNYSTLIDYGGKASFDVKDKQEIYFTELDYVPDYISIGSGVCAEIGMQVRDITYQVESFPVVKEQLDKYTAALLQYSLLALNLKEIDKNTAPEKRPEDIVIYTWNNTTFSINTNTHLLEDTVWDSFKRGDIRLFTHKPLTIPSPTDDFIPLSHNLQQKYIDDAFKTVVEEEQKLITLIQTEIEKQKESGRYEQQ